MGERRAVNQFGSKATWLARLSLDVQAQLLAVLSKFQPWLYGPDDDEVAR